MKYCRGPSEEVSWRRGRSTLSPSLQLMMWGSWYVRAAIQKDPGRLKKWPNGNFMQFNKHISKVQHLRTKSPPCNAGGGCTWATLQTQPRGHGRGQPHRSPMIPAAMGANSWNSSTGASSREIISTSAQHSLDHIWITEASLGTFGTGQAPTDLRV